LVSPIRNSGFTVAQKLDRAALFIKLAHQKNVSAKLRSKTTFDSCLVVVSVTVPIPIARTVLLSPIWIRIGFASCYSVRKLLLLLHMCSVALESNVLCIDIGAVLGCATGL
jgi:hypothetical protein